MKSSILIAVVLLTWIAAGGPVKEKKAPILILKSANTNENTFSNGEFISVLRGNVVFVYDDVTIHSDEATWWRNKGMVNFQNKVKVFRGKQTLTCDNLHFTKETDMLTAQGHFNFYDTAQKTRLTGNQGEYQLAKKTFYLTGNPTMIRPDSASAETLKIVGVQMVYIDSLKRATVSDKVRITKGPMISVCQLAHYYTEKNIANLRVKPEVTYEVHHVTGDSIDLFFGKESLKSARVIGNSHGIYIDTSASAKDSTKAKRDTMLTHIWSDSLFMTVSDSGFLDSLWSYGKVKSKYYASSDPKSANEANGKVMLLSFSKSGAIDNLKIWGNARSIYYIEDQGGNGRNEATGDSITVTFGKKGKAKHLSLAGSARGIYYPQDAASSGQSGRNVSQKSPGIKN